MAERVVLAYSGGLDTSVAVRWLIENEGVEVIAVAVNVGQAAERGGEDWDAIRTRALSAGAVEAVVVDARTEMAEEFCVPALQANARYEGKYPLVSALSRPVIVRHLVAEARRHGATAVAHGCTGKGNDQVRFEVGTRALAPDLDIYAPARVWGLSPRGLRRAGRQVGDPHHGDEGQAVFDRRQPVGQGDRVRGYRGPMGPGARRRLHPDPGDRDRAGRGHRRLRGGRSRLARRGHRWTPSRSSPSWAGSPGAAASAGSTWWRTAASGSRAGRSTSARPRCRWCWPTPTWRTSPWSGTCITRRRASSHGGPSSCTTGLWFSPLKSALDAFIAESQRHVTGEVRLRFAPPGTCTVVGRRSPVALYDHDLATYDASDSFRHADAEGFVRLWGLGVATWSARQGPGADAKQTKRGGVMTLWKGRISTGMAESVATFTVSLPFDKVLAPDDLVGSRAHVKGLGKVGILTDSEVSQLLDTLDLVEEEFETGSFVFEPGDEDIHTPIERRVTELAGDAVGAKLHTGRSRNDQIATDLRLWCRRSLVGVAAEIMALQDVLAQRALEAADVYLPGYTHMQRAQPVLLGHHLLAHGWALARDVDRLLVTVDRLNTSPLGAGALAGSSLPLDPDFVAAELGFHGRFENSLDAVSDRDFVAEALFDIALLGVHLSRMGEELVLWSTEEFGFCTLDDAYATGSSMLPQKKNPDVAELARGKAGRLIGHLNAVLITLKGLPLAYNRDLQEDKEPLFDAVVAGVTCPDRAARRVRHRDVERGADAGRRRWPGRRRHRSGRDAGRAGHALPPGPRAGRWDGPRFVGAPRASARAGGGAPRLGRGRR